MHKILHISKRHKQKLEVFKQRPKVHQEVGVRRPSLETWIPTRIFQVAKDPMVLRAFDCTTNTGNVRSILYFLHFEIRYIYKLYDYGVFVYVTSQVPCWCA